MWKAFIRHFAFKRRKRLASPKDIYGEQTFFLATILCAVNPMHLHFFIYHIWTFLSLQRNSYQAFFACAQFFNDLHVSHHLKFNQYIGKSRGKKSRYPNKWAPLNCKLMVHGPADLLNLECLAPLCLSQLEQHNCQCELYTEEYESECPYKGA